MAHRQIQSGHKQQQQRRTLVVKLGGAAGVEHAAICADIARHFSGGTRVLVVHGGSAEANQLGAALGYPPRFITSPSGFTSRYTDRTTLEIFMQAVNGKVNSLLVEQLQQLGVNALGLSGLDGRLMVAQRKAAVRVIEGGRQKVLRDDFTGKIEQVAVSLLQSLLVEGYLPVIAPLAVSEAGEALNVDADRAAAMIAAGLGADLLLMLTAVPGLMRAYPDERTLIDRLARDDLEQAMDFAQGRMKKKLLGAQEALEAGVAQVVIAAGSGPAPLSAALNGAGTLIS